MKDYVFNYANDKINSILYNDLIKTERKQYFRILINKIISLYNDGVITTDEAMLMIAKI